MMKMPPKACRCVLQLCTALLVSGCQDEDPHPHGAAKLDVTPLQLDFGAGIAEKAVTVRNVGQGTDVVGSDIDDLQFEVSATVDWLNIRPTFGRCAANEQMEIFVSAKRENMSHEHESTDLTVSSNAGDLVVGVAVSRKDPFRFLGGWVNQDLMSDGAALLFVHSLDGGLSIYEWDLCFNAEIYCDDSERMIPLRDSYRNPMVYDVPNPEYRHTLSWEVLENGELRMIERIYYDPGSSMPDIEIEDSFEKAPPQSDLFPPSAIQDLNAVYSPYGRKVDLSWTAPGDDGRVGRANSYDIRYSTDKYSFLINWILVQQSLVPREAGTVEEFSIPGLVPGRWYYFMVTALDEARNWSSIRLSFADSAWVQE